MGGAGGGSLCKSRNFDILVSLLGLLNFYRAFMSSRSFRGCRFFIFEKTFNKDYLLALRLMRQPQADLSVSWVNLPCPARPACGLYCTMLDIFPGSCACRPECRRCTRMPGLYVSHHRHTGQPARSYGLRHRAI